MSEVNKKNGLLEKLGFSDENIKKFNALSSKEKSDLLIEASAPHLKNKKNDIFKALIFNEHNIKVFDTLEPSDRLEILYNLFHAIDVRQDKETFFIDIVEASDQEKANEWVKDLTAEERADFKDFYPQYYAVFTQKPSYK